MNSKIQELLDRVGGYGTNALLDSDELKTFALLVMEECASACNYFECGRTMSSNDLIKERFGVE